MDFKKEYEKIIRNRSVVSYLFRIFLYSFLTPLSLSCLQDYRESTAASPALLLQARKVSCFCCRIGNGGS